MGCCEWEAGCFSFGFITFITGCTLMVAFTIILMPEYHHTKNFRQTTCEVDNWRFTVKVHCDCFEYTCSRQFDCLNIDIKYKLPNGQKERAVLFYNYRAYSHALSRSLRCVVMACDDKTARIFNDTSSPHPLFEALMYSETFTCYYNQDYLNEAYYEAPLAYRVFITAMIVSGYLVAVGIALIYRSAGTMMHFNRDEFDIDNV